MSETERDESARPAGPVAAQVRSAITEIAPDLTADQLERDLDLHYDLGLDSIDLLNVAGAIAERTGVEIPESAAPTLRSVGDLVDYVVARREGPG